MHVAYFAYVHWEKVICVMLLICISERVGSSEHGVGSRVRSSEHSVSPTIVSQTTPFVSSPFLFSFCTLLATRSSVKVGLAVLTAEYKSNGICARSSCLLLLRARDALSSSPPPPPLLLLLLPLLIFRTAHCSMQKGEKDNAALYQRTNI